MKIEQKEWTAGPGWRTLGKPSTSNDANLVLAFGGKKQLVEPDRYQEIREFYPKSQIVLTSTAGEILAGKINDNSIALTAITFEGTQVKTLQASVSSAEETQTAAEQIMNGLDGEDLVYVLILSDGAIVNASEVVKTFSTLRTDVIVSGGLAGDGPNFQSTVVGLNEVPTNGVIVGVGFYGKNLKVGHAAQGGWDPFGPERVITRSKNNVLYELDDRPALDLYKKYLGDLSSKLPEIALSFPLSLRQQRIDSPLVRTILSVDEKEKSITLAGDMPIGATVRMLKSNFNRLIDSARNAANSSVEDFGSFDPELSILVSCAGRKFVLQNEVHREIEKVRDVLGENTAITGFYAYGEISPIVKSTACELHNQTMTITTLKEELV